MIARGQPLESRGGDFRQQAAHVAEMMRGCGVRNSGATRALAERKSFNTALFENALRGGDQRRGEVAMVIGLAAP